MWPKWLTGRIKFGPRSPRLGRSFSCSSFKDIQDLCRDPPAPENLPDSPRAPAVLHRVSSAGSRFAESPRHPPPPSVVVYFTSLRVVRKTYEDCRAIRSILRGLRVPIDERDLAMDASHVAELQGITGRRRPSLPCVVVGGRLVGGLEEVRRLSDTGELWAMVSPSPSRGGRDGSVAGKVAGGGCVQCGELRYVVCDRCNGSRRIYGKGLSVSRTCKVCNANGLIKCPRCSLSLVTDAPNHY